MHAIHALQWLTLNFCNENSSTRSSSTLFNTPSRAYFEFQFLENLFFFHDQVFLLSNLLSLEFCMSEMGILQLQPLSTSLLLKSTNFVFQRFHFALLLHEFRSRFNKQMISIPIKQRSCNICWNRESDKRFVAPKTLVEVSKANLFHQENLFWFNLFWLENNATSFPEFIISCDELDIKFSRSEWETCVRWLPALVGTNGEPNRARNCSSSNSESARAFSCSLSCLSSGKWMWSWSSASCFSSQPAKCGCCVKTSFSCGRKSPQWMSEAWQRRVWSPPFGAVPLTGLRRGLKGRRGGGEGGGEGRGRGGGMKGWNV